MTDEFDRKAATWDDRVDRVERAKAVARRIVERVPLDRDMDALDFGSGTGLLGFELLPHVRSMAFADASEGMLDRVRDKLREGGHDRGAAVALDPDALALPRRYDLIVSLMTLHHVPDTGGLLRFLADHLAPGGWLALCDLDTEDGSFHDDPAPAVHHGFDRARLLVLVEDAGLVGGEARTAFTIRKERPGSVDEYPLFLLTARRPEERRPR